MVGGGGLGRLCGSVATARLSPFGHVMSSHPMNPRERKAKQTPPNIERVIIKFGTGKTDAS